MFKFSIIVIRLLLLSLAIAATVGAQEEFCKNTKGVHLFPHEKYCDHYYRCDRNHDRAILEMCPNGLVFAGARRGLMKNCDYPHNVGCPDGDRVMGQSPYNKDLCPWKYGVFAHETSCTRYVDCWNGTATVQQCPFSLLYNEKIHSCDWADNVNDCQKHPICKDSPNGRVAIEKSCTRYWLCVGGYPRLHRCPAGLAFNPNVQKCDIEASVPGCEPPPTPAPTEEDGKQDG